MVSAFYQTNMLLDFYNTSSMKQQSMGRHVAPLGHIILNLSQAIIPVNLWEQLGGDLPPTNSSKGEILCVAFKAQNCTFQLHTCDRVAMLQLKIFYRRILCMFLLLIDVFFLFVSVLNQLHPISIYIVYISVLLVVFHMMNEG